MPTDFPGKSWPHAMPVASISSAGGNIRELERSIDISPPISLYEYRRDRARRLRLPQLLGSAHASILDDFTHS